MKGICVCCGVKIPEERMECMPETEICVVCSEKIGGEYIYYGSATQLGREGSLKRITGGCEVVKIKRDIPRRFF